MYYGDSFSVTAAGADGAVSYSLSDNVEGREIAEIDSDGRITLSGIGKVTVTATSKKEGYADRTATKTFEVHKRILTPTAAAENRTYNGENGVSVTLSLDGIVSGDAVTAEAQGSMINADAGTGKIVYVSGITLSDDTNYTLSTQSLQTTVDITPIEVNGFTVTSENKTYDGTAVAQAAVTELSGVLAADQGQVTLIGTAVYDSAEAGQHFVTYRATGLTGAKAGNYRLTADQAVTQERYGTEPMKIFFTIGQTSFVYDGVNKGITLSANDELGRILRITRCSMLTKTAWRLCPTRQAAIPPVLR